MTALKDDPVAQTMKRNGLEITRANYIAFNWGNTAPEPWTAENEAELPNELRDPSQIETDDGGAPPADEWSEDGILAQYYGDRSDE
jgi:hypothetical protein